MCNYLERLVIHAHIANNNSSVAWVNDDGSSISHIYDTLTMRASDTRPVSRVLLAYIPTHIVVRSPPGYSGTPDEGLSIGLSTCYSSAYTRRLVNSSALQSWKWQLTGMSWWYRGAICSHPLPINDHA